MTKNESLSLYWSGYRAAFVKALHSFNKHRSEISDNHYSQNEIYLRGFESGLDAVENTLLRVIERHKKE